MTDISPPPTQQETPQIKHTRGRQIERFIAVAGLVLPAFATLGGLPLPLQLGVGAVLCVILMSAYLRYGIVRRK